MKRYWLALSAAGLGLLQSGCGSEGDGTESAPVVTECFGRPLPARAIGTAEPPVRSDGLEPYWPTDAWRAADPADLGRARFSCASSLQ